MASTLSGFPKSVVEASDVSTLLANVLRGRFMVQLATERGEVGKGVLIANWEQFKTKLGGVISGRLGAIIAKRALDLGAQLYVFRAGHYTDVSDKGTLVGTKSTVTLAKVLTAETRATVTFEVTAAGDDDDVITLKVNKGPTIVTIGSYTKQTSDTADDVAAGLNAAINALTATTGFSSAVVTDTLTISAPVGSGASANSYIGIKEVEGTVNGVFTPTSGAFSGGVTQITAGEVGSSTWTGKHIGPAYSATVTVTAAKSGTAGKVDIEVSLAGYAKATQTLREISEAPTEAEKNSLNSQLDLVDLSAFTTRIALGTVTLSGGTYDPATITDTDIIGDSSAGTGMYAFNTIKDALRIVNFEFPSNTVDNAYVSYCENRKDVRVILRFPLSLTPEGALAYRLQTSPYSGSVINSMYGRYVYGDIKVSHPDDVNNKIWIPAIGDVIGNRAKADNRGGEWISEAGGDYIITQADEILYDMSAFEGIRDTAYENGINAVINHETLGIIYFGNRSLLRDTTKLTSKENIADLMLPIIRFMKVAADKRLFKPNDPQTWNELYREARLWIRNVLVAGRAIQGEASETAGEGKQWFWIGDQLANTIDDVKFNVKAEVEAGKYRARFVFKPIPAVEYIGIEATATDSANLQFAITEGI